MRQRAVRALLAAAVVAAPALLFSQSAPASPRLLVIVVVDQMRSEYLDRYAAQWTDGFKRLRAEGAVFTRAFYPYLNTVTCTGHATIATGAYPYAHGVIMNEWFVRSLGARRACTDDPRVTSVPYQTPAEKIGHSAERLRTPTLGDRLRARSAGSRVVTLSMKPRSTVMLAGHGGTAVTWFGDSNTWATSTAYAQAPVAPVKTFLDAHPVTAARDLVWDRLRPMADYRGQDDVSTERPPAGRGRTFPHPLAGLPGTAPERFFDLWERSPYADDYLADMASALVHSLQLGQRDSVDYLGVSFSALDYVGHDFGPDSHEVQDTLFRLDRTLGRLLAMLDREVGRGGYALGLSADHGVAEIPEARVAAGLPGGRVLNAEVAQVAEAAMQAAHGGGPHVAHVEYTNLYLTPEARTRAAENPAFLAPLIEAVAAMPGVAQVFRGPDLAHRRTSDDALERAAALSYHPDESGDIVVALQPYWIGTGTSATTHGSSREYDQHVPVVFLGAPFKAGRYDTLASPADIVPTLATLIGLPAADVDGHVRREAIAAIK